MGTRAKITNNETYKKYSQNCHDKKVINNIIDFLVLNNLSLTYFDIVLLCNNVSVLFILSILSFILVFYQNFLFLSVYILILKI